MSTLAQIEQAAKVLPVDQKQWLIATLQAGWPKRGTASTSGGVSDEAIWSPGPPVYGCASGSQLRFRNKSPEACLNRIDRAVAELSAFQSSAGLSALRKIGSATTE